MVVSCQINKLNYSNVFGESSGRNVERGDTTLFVFSILVLSPAHSTASCGGVMSNK